MAKKPKILEQLSAAADAAITPVNGDSATRSSENQALRKAKKIGVRTRKAPVKKSKTAPSEPNDDAIRLRAYFISEQRIRMAIPGDANSDWVEARRQLLAEREQE